MPAHTKKVRMPPNMIYAMVGMTREQLESIVKRSLHASGIDISDPKAIRWERMQDGGCLFEGPRASK